MSQAQPVPKGKIVNFKPLKEEWSDYSLTDGTILRIKVVVSKVMRLHKPDGSPSFSPTGEPAYYFHSQNVVQVLSPAEYKQMKDEELKE